MKVRTCSEERVSPRDGRPRGNYAGPPPRLPGRPGQRGTLLDPSGGPATASAGPSGPRERPFDTGHVPSSSRGRGGLMSEARWQHTVKIHANLRGFRDGFPDGPPGDPRRHPAPVAAADRPDPRPPRPVSCQTAAPPQLTPQRGPSAAPQPSSPHESSLPGSTYCSLFSDPAALSLRETDRTDGPGEIFARRPVALGRARPPSPPPEITASPPDVCHKNSIASHITPRSTAFEISMGGIELRACLTVQGNVLLKWGFVIFFAKVQDVLCYVIV